MQKYFFYFFLLMTCSFLNCYAAETFFDEVSESSIQKACENKFYLKPGSVQIAKNGIFIHVDNQLLPINHLAMDDEGVYFEPSYSAKIESCETCGLPLLWGKCANPSCPSKKKKKK